MPKKGRIRESARKVASVGKGRIRESVEKVEIRASAGKGQNPGECRKS